MSGDVLHGYLPPQAIEEEEALLGVLLLESDAFEKIDGTLFKEYFYKDQNKKIFETIESLYRKNEPIDLLTCTRKLNDLGILDEIGGAYYITKLTSNVASAAHIEKHSNNN